MTVLDDVKQFTGGEKVLNFLILLLIEVCVKSKEDLTFLKLKLLYEDAKIV